MPPSSRGMTNTEYPWMPRSSRDMTEIDGGFEANQPHRPVLPAPHRSVRQALADISFVFASKVLAHGSTNRIILDKKG